MIERDLVLRGKGARGQRQMASDSGEGAAHAIIWEKEKYGIQYEINQL